MKTIFIIIGGMSDLPETSENGKTPLMMARKTELDTLAKLGTAGLVQTKVEGIPLTPANAVLSILGYDFDRGIPDEALLESLGNGDEADSSEVRFFVIPKFSGHGAVITNNPVIRGIGRTALLKPFPANPGKDEIILPEKHLTLAEMANCAIAAIEDSEFVMLYVDEVGKTNGHNDPELKAEAIERVSHELIGPVADYVWNSKLQMNLVVMSDRNVSWKTGESDAGDVPAVVYFNDDPPGELTAFDEISVCDGPLSAPLPGELIRQLFTFEN